MFLVLVKRAAALRARGKASDEEELDSLLNVMDAYEAMRWNGLTTWPRAVIACLRPDPRDRQMSFAVPVLPPKLGTLR